MDVGRFVFFCVVVEEAFRGWAALSGFRNAALFEGGVLKQKMWLTTKSFFNIDYMHLYNLDLQIQQ